MDFRLDAKRALVCGSTQGIGRAAAEALARAGASVTLLARDQAKLAQVRASLAASPTQRHDVLVADFSNPSSLVDAIRPFAGTTDPARAFHVVINNTGGPPGGLAIDAGVEQYTAAFGAHVVCNQVLAQALVPGMKAMKYGRIINVISTSVKQPIPGLGVSNTIRGAVASWAKTLASELGPFGITVNNVLPGFTSTERLASLIAARAAKAGQTEAQVAEDMRKTIPAGRFASPEEVAAGIVFLASPAAGYVNGINLPIDGGRLGCL